MLDVKIQRESGRSFLFLFLFNSLLLYLIKRLRLLL